INPISKADAIFASGFSAASFSFLASNRGLYNKIGRRLTKDGSAAGSSLEDFFLSKSSLLICASHIFRTLIIFSSLRVHPLSLPFRPFSFWVAFGSVDVGNVPSVTAFFSVTEDAVDVADFVEGSTAGASFGAAVPLTGGLVSVVAVLGKIPFTAGTFDIFDRSKWELLSFGLLFLQT
uniref:Uncharacterized protein n=1 Tax=Kryptolebias marmoratus TaxID=37003 RepID=A0A3Q2ZQ36_KRYMA